MNCAMEQGGGPCPALLQGWGLLLALCCFVDTVSPLWLPPTAATWPVAQPGALQCGHRALGLGWKGPGKMVPATICPQVPQSVPGDFWDTNKSRVLGAR